MKKKKFVGLTALLPMALFNVTALPVHAEVTDFQEADTSTEESSAECEVIYKSTYDFTEEIPKYPELDVTASGYEGIYDGKSHEITVDCKTEGATILYSTDGKTYSAKKPEYKNVGTYVTYYKVEKDGYTTTLGSAVVKIKEATIEFDADDCIVFYDGKNHTIDLSVKTDGCKVLYSEDGINYSSKKPEYKEPGTYTVYYKIMRDNYATVTGSSTVTIKPKDSAVNNSNQNSSNKNNASQNGGSQNNSNHNSSGTDGNANSGISKVQTGDESNIFFYAVMFVASAFGLTKLKGRKEKREKL
ncbi:MAG: sortase B protein-sorting domain-containing protein [Lachnospiraceae bacterium]|nr:sortase B protein-sorting domain-containing protein [Lachnospiraceae bacterium]